MRVWNRRGYFLDLLSELLGIKAGLALSEAALVGAIESGYAAHNDTALILGGPTRWWDGDKDDGIGVRAEEIEFALLVTMHHFGAVNDLRDTAELTIDFAREHAAELGIDASDFMALVGIVTQLEVELMGIGSARKPALTARITDQSTVAKLKLEFSRRNIMDQTYPEDREWDGQIPLDDLFQSEDIPINASAECYFDQRFIDYLLAQPQSLTSINWRQFEYLTAEYFQRNGYEVAVGPGRNDGGLDVSAIKKARMPGPELVVIQCRRYGESNPVGIDKVRSFWTTVDDAGATRGMIATTSRLTKGARSYCDARKYRLTAAEGDAVKAWLTEMARVDRNPGGDIAT